MNTEVNRISVESKFNRIIPEVDVLLLGTYWDQNLKERYTERSVTPDFSSKLGENSFMIRVFSRARYGTLVIGPGLIRLEGWSGRPVLTDSEGSEGVLTGFLEEYDTFTKWISKELSEDVVSREVSIVYEETVAHHPSRLDYEIRVSQNFGQGIQSRFWITHTPNSGIRIKTTCQCPTEGDHLRSLDLLKREVPGIREFGYQLSLRIDPS